MSAFDVSDYPEQGQTYEERDDCPETDDGDRYEEGFEDGAAAERARCVAVVRGMLDVASRRDTDMGVTWEHSEKEKGAIAALSSVLAELEKGT